MKLLTAIFALIAMATLSGCAGILKSSEANYSSNLDRRNAAKLTCLEKNRNTVSLQDSGGNPIMISHAAGGCEFGDIIHGGAYVAQIAGASIGALGNVAGAGIAAYQSRENTQDNNETAVLLSELENVRQIDRNGVLRDAIATNSDQTTALSNLTTSVTDQNVAITAQNASLNELITQLSTPATTAEEGTDEQAQ